MRYVLPFSPIIAALLTSSAVVVAGDASFELTLKEHQFTPAVLTIQADQRVKLTIKNLDSTPAEFESKDFKAEKIIPAGGSVNLYIGPLKAGTYSFFDDFHADQAKGTLTAK